MPAINCTDILGLHCLKERIATMNKSQLISYISTINESIIKRILLRFCTSLMDMSWCDDLLYEWYKTFTTKPEPHAPSRISNKTNIKNSTLLSSLPTCLGAYTISYCDMHERLKCKLVSKHFYNFCRASMSKSHLIIDKNFVEALASNTINYREYYDAHLDTVDVKFVFLDPGSSKCQHTAAQMEQFDILSNILEKARNFKTLNYKLTHYQFQSSFNDKYLDKYGERNEKNNKQSYFIVWAYWLASTNADIDSIAKCKLFHSVDTVNIHQHKNYSILLGKEDVDSFKSLFPNIQKLTIGQAPFSHHPHFWDIFGQKYYGQTLQYLDIDLSSTFADSERMNIAKHPLYVLPSLHMLTTLILKIKIAELESETYYQMLVDSKSFELKCLRLKSVKLVFDHAYRWNIRSGVVRIREEVTNVVNAICVNILDSAPNLTDFACLFTNDLMLNKPPNFNKLNYLIGHTHKLRSLNVTDTNSLNINNISVPIMSLKTLMIDTYSTDPLKDLLKTFNLSMFPNLEKLSFCYKGQGVDLNENVIQFLKYLIEQTKVNHMLKYIHLDHPTKSDELCKKVRQQNKQNIVCSDKISEEICKLLIQLRSLKTIEISPLFLRKQHYEYLSFWFGGNFGGMNSKIHGVKYRKTYFMNITVCSKGVE